MPAFGPAAVLRPARLAVHVPILHAADEPDRPR